MATLATATLLVILDSIAKGVEHFEDGVGILGTEASTVSKGAANNVTTLAAVADLDVQRDLASVFAARADAVKAPGMYGLLRGAVIQRALDQHYGAAAGSLNQHLTDADERVHPDLRLIGFHLDAVNAFMATAVDPVASFAVTGSGAGTLTAGSSIDTSLYGKANMQVETTSLIGAASITATLTMTKYDGSTESEEVTIASGAASGTTYAIGTPDTDMYVGCSAISITGGTADDAFKIISVVERAIAL